MLKKLITADFRYLSLGLGLGLYAGFSSPTPDAPGLVELLIAVLLMVASLPAVWRMVRDGLQMGSLWRAAGFMLLCYGVGVMLVLGAVGNDMHYIVRDVLPFIFLFLPLFVGDLFIDSPQRGRMLLGGVLLMGVISAVRALVQGADFLLFNFSGGTELYYLANAPTILFAAALGWYGFLYGVSGAQRYGLAVAGLLMFLLGLLVMGMTLQRASIGFLMLYAVVVSGLIIWQRPRVLFFLVPVVALLVAPFLGDFALLLDALIGKTQAYGFNNRAQEWAAVWNEATQSVLRFVFGGGWGATFESPAVAGARVNFTHGMFGAMLLKGGLLGVVLLAAYIVGLGQVLWEGLKRYFVVAFAILGPFMIDVLLYGAYKSLDFGVLLLLMPVALLSRFSE